MVRTSPGSFALDELLGELGNLRIALDWAAPRNPRSPTSGLWLAGDLYDVWTAGAHHDEGLARLHGLLQAGRGSPDGRSRAARNAAIVAAHMGHGDPAVAFAEQALHEAARGASSAQERRARQVLAQFLRDHGDVAKARRTLTPALPAGSEQTTDVDAFCLVTRSSSTSSWGHLDEAEAYCPAGPHRRIRVACRGSGRLRDSCSARSRWSAATSNMPGRGSATHSPSARRSATPTPPSTPTSDLSTSSALPAAPMRPTITSAQRPN